MSAHRLSMLRARMRVGIAATAIGLLAYAGACGENAGVTEVPEPGTPALPPVDSTDSEPILGDTMPVLSDPVIGLAASSAASLANRGSVLGLLQSGDGGDVAYVSLRPGTVPGGQRATIQRRGSATTVTAAMEAGGLDPVPVAAAPGDSVDVEVEIAGGALRRFSLPVPATRRPRIVRTHPPPRKKDVALNSGIVVVFTEPVDEATVSSSSIQLLKGGTTPVAGTVRALEGAAAAVVFEPSSQLDASTIYRLVVTDAVRDLDGDGLEARDTVEFTTGTDYAPNASRVTILPDTTALGVGSHVQLSAITMAGDDTMRTRIFGVPIGWISDNVAVASVSATGLVTAIDEGEARIRAVVLTQQDVFGSAIVIASGTLAPVESVELEPAPAIAALSGRIDLTAVPRDAAGNALPFRQISWTTSDSTIATVEPASGGRAWVTAAAVGTATITATVDGKSAAARIAVVRPGAYAQLSAGGGGSQTYTCSLTTDSWALCWGNNHAGQLGNTLSITAITPTAVARGLRFSSISTGSAVTCGLTSSGAAYCWGDNSMGTLGNGSATGPEQCIYGPCSLAPVAVSGGLTFSEIDIGEQRFACALTSNGAAYCWGSNEHGMLGIASATGPESCDPYAQDPAGCSRTPVAVAGGLTFSTISTGGSHACGLTASGAAYCWGANHSGQLGDGTTTERHSPTRVAGDVSFASITADWSHTCALTSAGEAYCWGENGHGQLGLGSSDGPESCRDQFETRPCSRVPVAVPGFTRWESVTAGGFHTCALTAEGAAYCWGWNGNGVLGDGTTTGRSTPTPVTGGLTFANLTASDSHTCGVTVNNIAYCWGNNQSGALGSGTTGQDPITTPVRVTGQP